MFRNVGGLISRILAYLRARRLALTAPFKAVEKTESERVITVSKALQGLSKSDAASALRHPSRRLHSLHSGGRGLTEKPAISLAQAGSLCRFRGSPEQRPVGMRTRAVRCYQNGADDALVVL